MASPVELYLVEEKLDQGFSAVSTGHPVTDCCGTILTF
jgi:hypothetical protein